MKFIYLILFAFFFSSCSSKIEKTKIIKKFSKPFIDSLQPNKKLNNKYIVFNVEIKGFTNDSIIVFFSKNKKKPIYLTGEINKRYWEEYAGKTKKYLRILPYKATKGKLVIKYGLYK